MYDRSRSFLTYLMIKNEIKRKKKYLISIYFLELEI